jgi:phage baseplate assembly protein W
MARPIYQYKPFIDASDVAVGIKLPFNKGAIQRLEITGSGGVLDYASDSTYAAGNGVFALSYTTEDQAISNLSNLLLTRKGERIMQPNFGTRIQDSIFEQNTDILLDNIRSTIEEDVAYWLPYIELLDVDVKRTNFYENSIQVAITFRVSQQGANLVINVLASENQIVLSQVTTVSNVNTQLVAVGRFSSGEFNGIS